MTAMTITIDERDGGGAGDGGPYHFDSLEGMQEVLVMGAEEGTPCGFGQIGLQAA